MTDAMVARVVERLRAMADENRVRMLLHLKHGPASVNELASAIGINQPSVSKHLSVLKQVGIVDCQRRGTTASYFIKDETIFDLCALVCQGVRSFAAEQHEALGLSNT